MCSLGELASAVGISTNESLLYMRLLVLVQPPLAAPTHARADHSCVRCRGRMERVGELIAAKGRKQCKVARRRPCQAASLEVSHRDGDWSEVALEQSCKRASKSKEKEEKEEWRMILEAFFPSGERLQ